MTIIFLSFELAEGANFVSDLTSYVFLQGSLKEVRKLINYEKAVFGSSWPLAISLACAFSPWHAAWMSFHGTFWLLLVGIEIFFRRHLEVN